MWRGCSVELTVQWAMTVHTKETQAEEKELKQKRKSGTQVKCRINSRWQQKGRWGREALTLGHPGMMTLFQILGEGLRKHLDIYKHFQGWPETQRTPPAEVLQLPQRPTAPGYESKGVYTSSVPPTCTELKSKWNNFNIYCQINAI